MSRADQVLDHWAARRTAADIASAVGVPVQHIRYIVYRARIDGDARAAKRGRKDGRQHDCLGIYRTKEQTRALKDLVLNAWAQGFDGYDIAAEAGISRAYVDTIVSRARRAGDARAARRERYLLPPGGRCAA